jgi:hypothetical protein
MSPANRTVTPHIVSPSCRNGSLAASMVGQSHSGLSAGAALVRSIRRWRFLPRLILAQPGLVDLVDQRFDCGYEFSVTCLNDGSKLLRIVRIRSGPDK